MPPAKKNTPGLGIEYEVHLPAFFALLLNTKSEIEYFKLQSNVQDFGKLDDLLVDIKTKSDENFYFGFQLKHKDDSNKNLLPTNFEAKGNFNLEKYCETFKKLNEENRKYHFILYTNNNFDSSRTNEVKRFDMKQDECSLGRNFFDTSGDGKNLYKFAVNEGTEDGKNVNKNDFREFFSQFSLYTGQANVTKLENYILKILKYEECTVKYVDFFRRWHKGEFTDKVLDKRTLNAHLLDIFLSSAVINHQFSDYQDKNSMFFEAIVQHFDITIINDSKQNFKKPLEDNVKYSEELNKNSKVLGKKCKKNSLIIKRCTEDFKRNSVQRIIRLGKDSKFIDKNTRELKNETKVKLLHYFFQKPLILDFHEFSQDIIYEASKLCKIEENGFKLVIVGQGIDESKFSHLKTFTNLSGVDGDLLEEIKRRCNLLLQGRNVSFGEIFEDEIREFVTPRDVFLMLNGSFRVGEKKEKLPECYIPRAVSTMVFDIESVIKYSSRNAKIILYWEDKFEELKILIQKIVDGKDYFYGDYNDIVYWPKFCSQMHLNEDNSKDTFPDEIPTIILSSRIGQYKFGNEFEKNVYFFKVIDGKRCLLLNSSNNILSHNENFKYTKMSIEEDNIHVFFNNSINVLCAQPGMGKSALMKCLKNQYDPNFWTVLVDLKAHNQFLKRNNHKMEEVLNYFLELDKCEDTFLLSIKNVFLRKKKIVLFLDGLDEVENECVDCVLNITRQLSEMGFRIWLSSRQNLQEKIEQYFNIFSIEINELNEDQQKNYIENRLTSLYGKNEIEEIVDLIFSNTDLANNRQILEIPLQLHIITQIFLDDKSYYFNLRKNNFTLTKMFEIFFEGKYNHYLAKIDSKHNHLLGRLEEKLENYELVALHSVLDDEHFQKLQIEKFKQNQIKNSDFLGIITEINRENKAVFEHLTFAEYFASKFLVKNVDKARILKEEIFTKKYQNLLLIFNIILAEDSPLHLAIIYKDLSRIQEMEESSEVDKGGRNFLQVAACVATRHPLLEFNPKPFSSEYLVKDKSVQQFKGEDLQIQKIVKICVLSSEPFQNDNIFEWNTLDYALATGALYIIEAILEKFEKAPNFYEILGKYYSDEVVAYYSIRFGYHCLLSKILEKKTCDVTNILSEYLGKMGSRNSILHFIMLPNCANRIRIVELLISGDVNRTICEENGFTFLHLAVMHDNIEIINFLLEKGADVNIGKDGRSPLILAANQNNFEISKLLIKNGANGNNKDKHGRSPLFWSVINKNNLNISKLLLDTGADVNATDEDERSPLFWATKTNNLEILELLMERGAKVNLQDKDGRSPLFWAVRLNNFEICKYLIEKDAEVNMKDKEGRTPLFFAAFRDNLEIPKLLINKGADINSKTKQNKTPLSTAIKFWNVEVIKLLVEKGANVNETDKNFVPLTNLAAKKRDFNLLQILIKKGANWNGWLWTPTSK